MAIYDTSLPLLGAYALVGPVVILAATYAYTWLQSFPATPHTGREPPLVPYWLPYLGHIFAFLRDPGKLLQTSRYKLHNIYSEHSVFNA